MRTLFLLCALALAAAGQVRVMATPTSMRALASILRADKSREVARWNILLKNDGQQTVELAREEIIMALHLPAMTPEEFIPILKVKAGGRWRILRDVLADLGVGVGIGFYPPAAALGPVLKYLETRVSTNQIPDVTPLLKDLPERVRLGPGDGVTYPLYASPIPKAAPIGPVAIYGRPILVSSAAPIVGPRWEIQPRAVQFFGD